MHEITRMRAMAFGLAAAAGVAAMISAALAEPVLPAEKGAVTIAPADLALTDGHIYTPSGWADSVAVHDGVIVAVGNEAAIKPYLNAETKIIDLKGRTVLPGLHDMHVHPASAGLAHEDCQLPQSATPSQIFTIVAGCVKRHKPGEWITGRAFEAAAFGKMPPNRYMLDKVAPDNPVLLTDISGHSAWANSLALKLAGITKDTPDPHNGIIERDANGVPTGLLRESAAGLVSRLLPPPTREQYASALNWALHQLLDQGVTSLDDAFVNEDIARAYDDLADSGKLVQRVRGCLDYQEEGLIERRGLYARSRFSPSCIKIFLDGVPTDSHTAAMLEEYERLPGGENVKSREYGMLKIPPKTLDALLIRFDSMGMTVKMHAAGDAAVHEGIEAIAAAREAHGFSGLLHDTAHNSFVHMSDIKEARAIGAAMEFSPYIWYRSPIIDDIQKAVHPELMDRWIPIKDALDAGVLAVPGSDWPVVPVANPWLAIETMVTREKPGGVGKPLGPAERISLKQAIDMYTINSARQQYNADKLGSIELGKLADVIVIDRNIFAVPITTVHDTKVLVTIINGKIVYDAVHPELAK